VSYFVSRMLFHAVDYRVVFPFYLLGYT